MTDAIPLSQQWEDVPEHSFPEMTETDTPVGLCIEPGCDNPVAKRGRGYSQFCSDHVFNHTVEGKKKPKSQRDNPVPKTDDRIKRKAEQQALALLDALQTLFIMQNDRYCAWAVGDTAQPIATNLGSVASDFKIVAKMLDKGDKYFALALLSFHVSRLAVMIGVHHDVIPYAGPIKRVIPAPPPKKEQAPNVESMRPTTVIHRSVPPEDVNNGAEPATVFTG